MCSSALQQFADSGLSPLCVDVMEHQVSCYQPCFSDMSQNKWMHMDLSAQPSLSVECNNWSISVCGIQAALNPTSSGLGAMENFMEELLSSTAIFF